MTFSGKSLLFDMLPVQRALFLMSSKEGGEKRILPSSEKNVKPSQVCFLWSTICWPNLVCVSEHLPQLYLHNPPFPNSFPSALWASEDPQKAPGPEELQSYPEGPQGAMFLLFAIW